MVVIFSVREERMMKIRGRTNKFDWIRGNKSIISLKELKILANTDFISD